MFMIIEGAYGRLTGLLMNFCRKLSVSLRSEEGQALVEHSLLIGISTAAAGTVAVLMDHPLIVIAVLVALFISLLFWKPKVLVTVLLIALLLLVSVFVYRLAEYGHL